MRALLLLLMAGCSAKSAVVTNSSFDEWEGTTPADWTIDRGSVQKVITWDKNDFGLELVGDDVQISQPLNQNVPCFTLEVVSSVEESATATIALALTVGGQSYGEYARDLPTSNWELFRYSGNLQDAADSGGKPRFLKIPSRLELRKVGSGRVVLGGVRITQSGCDIPPTLPQVSGVPLAEPCNESATCAAGLKCAPLDPILQTNEDTRACVACVSDKDCDSGDICGTQSANGNPARVCVSSALKTLGEACSDASECQTGACASDIIATSISGVCVDCDVQAGVCADFFWLNTPPANAFVGGFCVGHDDTGFPSHGIGQCEEGDVCVGEPSVGLCLGARTRCSAEGDCPNGDRCVGVGSYGGRCLAGQP